MIASLRGTPRSPRTVVLWLALWLTIVGNFALWRELWQIGSGGNTFSVVAPGVFVIGFAATVALLALTAWGRPMKAVWIAILIAAGVAQHFMLGYGVVMDSTMLASTMQTDPREVADLLSWLFLGDVLLVAALPALLVICVPVVSTRWWPQVWKNATLCLGALALGIGVAFAMFSQLAPLVRNHMNLRYIANPVAGLSSTAWVVLRPLFARSHKLVPISAGAALGPSYAGQTTSPLLVIVVGETARADHFSLDGYPRDTNPELALRSVLSFRDVRSCGTDTRDSVPCMFSSLGKEAFENRDNDHANLLDLLQAVGFAVLWIDNQAGCKSVCDRVPSVSTSDLPADVQKRLCPDGECFDEALLVGLDERIARLPEERRSAASSSSCIRWAATGQPTSSARSRHRSTSCPNARTRPSAIAIRRSSSMRTTTRSSRPTASWRARSTG